MRPTVDGSGYVTAWEGGSGATFALSPPSGGVDPTGLGYRVTGSSPNRRLVGPNGERIAAEVPAQPLPGSVDQESESGGSQTVESVFVPVAFNTPNIVVGPGVHVATLNAGDLLYLYAMSVTTAWDGTDVALFLSASGNTDRSQAFVQVGVETPDSPSSPGLMGLANSPSAGGTGYATAETEIICYAQNENNGTDPVSTQGAGTLILFVLRAA